MADVHVNIGDGGALILAGSVPATAEELFGAIRRAWGVSEAVRVWTAVRLAEADARGDWLRLGYESLEEYSAEVGIPPSTARKLRLIGATFGEQLLALIDGAVEPPSTARLYAAAQRVRRGQVDTETALGEAQVHPQHVLIAMRDAEADVARVEVRCPFCGRAHWCSGTSADRAGSVPG